MNIVTTSYCIFSSFHSFLLPLSLAHLILMVHLTCHFDINSVRRSLKSVVRKWFLRKKPLPSNRSKRRNNQTQHEPNEDNKGDNTMKGINGCNNGDSRGNVTMSSKRGLKGNRSRSFDSSCFFSIASSFSRNENRKNRSTRRKTSGSFDHESVPTAPSSLSNGSRSFKMQPTHQAHSRDCGSRRSCSTPIMFSNSSGMLKPFPIQKRLECTLEELCYGCTKQINIARDVITENGELAQEDEVLTINVQPGWKTGTKITFEGKGNDRPGKFREDIIFFISQKEHELFRRIGDDLELGIEIPLLKALTGCTIRVPLLGGEEINLIVDEIVYPGYEKVISGQGMPISKKPEKRGNLIITFLVDFPLRLTHSQRSEIVSILQDTC